ncbi:MAG: GNAT family N-acetyltransferase [Gemmiger sp.]|nr:GNAT family N-acetyltransferase [Gemmiger sp.]
MQILEIEERTPALVQQLLAVWEQSVTATHLFLSADAIKKIKTYVPPALCGVQHLVVATSERGGPVAFMGVEPETLQFLFVLPAQRGKGLGTRLLRYGMAHFGVKALTVNEQNPQAQGFYARQGFRIYKRTDLDEQGNAYPLLYMRREG